MRFWLPLLVMLATAPLAAPLALDAEGPESSPVAAQPRLACADTPLLVDGCGDTMSGLLILNGGLRVNAAADLNEPRPWTAPPRRTPPWR